MKLSTVEWRIAALVMARGPITVFAVAKALRLNYTLAKRGQIHSSDARIRLTLKQSAMALAAKDRGAA